MDFVHLSCYTRWDSLQIILLIYACHPQLRIGGVLKKLNCVTVSTTPGHIISN